ncbi:MAG: ABC-2 transporter permease [Defluviitaleaceae bacterium]|nr:ABC-2 transporter permease [Defluviitaleaceae bacterium]
MLAIYKKEMRTYFTNMMGYVFLAFLLLLIGIFFTLLNVRSMDGNFHFVLANVTVFFFILVPVLTMRLFSEESRQKTDQLLYTSPLTVTGIVLGKFFAALSLFLIGVAVTVVMPFLLRNYGDLPVAQIAGAYIGFVLLGAACIAIGVFVSVLTESQIIAAVGTMGAIFVMFLSDAIAVSMPTSTFASLMFVLFVIACVVAVWYNSTRRILAAVIVGIIGLAVAGGLYIFNDLIFDGIIVRVLLWFSIFTRFDFFARGALRISDIVYYISFAALFIYLTVNVIEKRRWR